MEATEISAPERSPVRLLGQIAATALTFFSGGWTLLETGHPIPGLLLMGACVAYLTYEMFASREVANVVPGMMRFVAAVFVLSVVLGVAVPQLRHPAPVLTTSGGTPPSAQSSPAQRVDEAPPAPPALRSRHHSAPSAQDLEYVPEIILLYRNKTIEVHNQGRSNLYIWGGAYGDSKIPIEPHSEPRMLAPTAFYYWNVDNFEDQLQAALSNGQEGVTTFHAFITTEDSKKHTIRGLIYAKKSNGELEIRTQELPTVEGWKDK